MFMITDDNCPFPFLCFCFCFCASVSDSASEFSVFVSGLQPRDQIHHKLRQPSSLVVECGIHGLVEYQSCNLNNIAVLK